MAFLQESPRRRHRRAAAGGATRCAGRVVPHRDPRRRGHDRARAGSSGPASSSSPGRSGPPAWTGSASPSAARSAPTRRWRPGGRVARLTDLGLGPAAARAAARARRRRSRRSCCAPACRSCATGAGPQRPVAVAMVPSRTRPLLVESLARGIAEMGRLQWLGRPRPGRRRTRRRGRRQQRLPAGRRVGPARGRPRAGRQPCAGSTARSCSSTTSPARAGPSPSPPPPLRRAGARGRAPLRAGPRRLSPRPARRLAVTAAGRRARAAR